MPELPEVERGRRLAESVARGRRITAVRCAKDPIVYEGVGSATWRRALVGRSVLDVGRRGKQLWFELDTTPWPLFHLGMTGQFRTPDAATLRLRSSGNRIDTDWPPRFWKIRLHFDDGGELIMTNARRLGRLRLRNDALNEPPISRLGFDPLLDLPSPKRFIALLANRSALMKPLLMDQSFAAGVGNWIADEVLYQAKIDPRRRANTLTEDEAKRVRAKLKSIVEKAVAADADKSRFPKAWLFHRRWGRNSDAVTVRGERIEHITLGGRTTAWVPEVQR
jgi:formamidopyrimidine-DNA glycosylase